MSKIFQLEVEKVKRIKTVNITPDGHLNIIGGQNGNGKSSTLDSIEMALRGKGAIPEKPVREGETSAQIIVDTGTYVVTRWWTSPTNTYLEVKTKDGKAVPSPQKVLDELVGQGLSFDPLAFVNYKDVDRLKILKDIAKVDFTQLDEEYVQKFDERRQVKKDGERINALLEGFKDLAEVPAEPLNLEELKREKSLIEDHNKDCVTAENNVHLKANLIENLKGGIVSKRHRLDELQKEIMTLQLNLNQQEAELKDAIEEHQGLQKRAALAQKKSTDAVDSKIAQYHAQEANKARVKQKANLEEELIEARNKYKNLDIRLKEIDQLKVKMITDAKLPISGLSLGDKDVMYNGIPFAQISTSEQIRVSMGIAMALNPDFRVILIKNGSLLDKKAMEELGRMAIENDFQVWVEKVMDGPDANCIYIEDGMITHQNTVTHKIPETVAHDIEL